MRRWFWSWPPPSTWCCDEENAHALGPIPTCVSQARLGALPGRRRHAVRHEPRCDGLSRRGYGGAIGHLLQSGQGTATLAGINVTGNAAFLTGQAAVQYSVTPAGPIALNARTSLQGSTAAAGLLQSLISGGGTHEFEAALGSIGSRALNLYSQVSAALGQAPVTTTVFPTAADPQRSLGAQLQLGAKLISGSSQLGAKSQVFFVSTGRYDTHAGLVTLHPTLLTNLADALRAFYDTTAELGVASQVTTFTGSDFGRALTANNDGTHHGWGSMPFVPWAPVRAAP